jgi:hypothetical protein
MKYSCIYFDSGGFYMFYVLMGSIPDIHTEYNRKNSRILREPKLYGNSAGAACALACYLVLHDLAPVTVINEMMIGDNCIIDRPRPFSLSFTPIMCELIDELLKYWPADLYKRVSGILHIGVTTKTGHKYISKFNSNADIYHAILCSMTVAGLTSHDTTHKKQTCIDGWYTYRFHDICDDCLVLTTDLYFPLVLTVPPKLIRTYLMAFGSAVVSDKCNGRKTDRGTIRDKWRTKDTKTVDRMFLLHDMGYKNPLWKRHIEEKTGSRITDGPPDKPCSWYDVIEYAMVHR